MPYDPARPESTRCRIHRTALSLSLVGVPFCHDCRREDAITYRASRERRDLDARLPTALEEVSTR